MARRPLVGQISLPSPAWVATPGWGSYQRVKQELNLLFSTRTRLGSRTPLSLPSRRISIVVVVFQNKAKIPLGMASVDRTRG
jgi:hypothetical protein